MNKNTNTIIINGQTYNALTGVLEAGSARTMDGVVGHGTSPAVALAAPRPAAAPQPLVSQVTAPVMDIARHPAPHAVAHGTQAGRTLMRSAVPKPGASLKRSVKAVGPANRSDVVSAALVQKSSVHAINPDRARRASSAIKSSFIDRFGGTVRTAQVQTAMQQKARAAAQEVSQATRPTLDIFERAIAAASATTQPPLKNVKLSKSTRRKRTAGLATVGLALVLLGGFITYQNVPNIKLQMASSRAGFKAALPEKRPPGFSMAALSYKPGTVDVQFNSNSDTRSFAIKQTASSWDSQALRDVFLTAAAGQAGYHTVETNGQTVYLYGNNATWVNGGIWYQVKTNGSLSDRQLVDLAASM
ncbi:MAG: hypothetical protein JWM81_73 [Candidatus Saccharibacteria bacterium]|nr:hypothetical protein [Candidatus Saccharibacteria bacterium]